MKQVTALQACQTAGLDFSEIFKWQYLASENPDLDLPMDAHAFGSWSVYVGKGLAVTRLTDMSGTDIGLLLGVGVDDTGMVSGTHRVAADAGSETFFEQIERWLHPLAGRYTLFVANAQAARVYCDAIGMNGCVYNAKTRAVASSVLLCLDRPVKPHPRYEEDHIEKGGKYSLFHTSDPEVTRCNPSCYLDLAGFEETRFWPGDQAFSSAPTDLPGIYDNLQKRTSFIIGSICDHAKVALPISGGQDSRLLMALAGPSLHGVDYFFTHILNYASRIDATIASELARRFQIQHHVIDRRKVRPPKDMIETAIEGFRIGCGFSALPPREIQLGLMQQMPADHLVMRGHVTDILRAVLIDRLGRKARENFRWQVKRLLIVPSRSFNESLYRDFLPDYQSWADTLPAKSRVHLIDLMFMEIYYSSTVGCTFPAISHGFFMSPFNSRALAEQCMRIPEAYRRRSAAVFDCIHRFTPSLAEVPVDYEFGGKRSLDMILDLNAMREITHPRRESTMRRYNTLRERADYTWADLA